jgi:putative membrane protein
MNEFLIWFYPWTKTLHILSVIVWMAGILGLSLLFSFHVEGIEAGSRTDTELREFERKIVRYVMNVVMTTTWVFGLMLLFTPGLVDWASVWPWTKAAAVSLITWYHHWLALRRKDFGRNPARAWKARYRLVGAISLVSIGIIVCSVVLKF